MIKREELLKTEEYWFETLQNEIYRIVAAYLENEGMNQSEFAEKLGVSKGYISQIMNGNFNYTLKKLIELSLAVNRIPEFNFKDINEFISEDRKRFEMQYDPFFTFTIQSKKTFVNTGIITSTNDIQAAEETCTYIPAA
jgi:transcriptional regulator with XRE-family HTH domain